MNRSLIFQRSKYLLNLISRRGVQFEPPYLDETKSDVPAYNPLNIQVKGYDYTVLERYAKWIHNTAVHMDIEVDDCWATPCKKLEVVSYRKNTSNIENKYTLQIYERNVQVAELSSTMAPVFLEVIKAALPEGVEMSVHEHMQEYFELRKIPDLQLKELRVQLDEMGGPSKKKH